MTRSDDRSPHEILMAWLWYSKPRLTDSCLHYLEAEVATPGTALAIFARGGFPHWVAELLWSHVWTESPSTERSNLARLVLDRIVGAFDGVKSAPDAIKALATNFETWANPNQPTEKRVAKMVNGGGSREFILTRDEIAARVEAVAGRCDAATWKDRHTEPLVYAAAARLAEAMAHESGALFSAAVATVNEFSSNPIKADDLIDVNDRAMTITRVSILATDWRIANA